jgi:hypothetical protein
MDASTGTYTNVWDDLDQTVKRAYSLRRAGDALEALRLLNMLVTENNSALHQAMEEAVREARRQNKRWREIAEATGTDRRLAWRRWAEGKGIR